MNNSHYKVRKADLSNLSHICTTIALIALRARSLLHSTRKALESNWSTLVTKATAIYQGHSTPSGRVLPAPTHICTVGVM